MGCQLSLIVSYHVIIGLGGIKYILGPPPHFGRAAFENGPSTFWKKIARLKRKKFFNGFQDLQNEK